MWYVAHLLFAQKPEKGRRRVMCESCRVLFQASSALECYDSALKWGKLHKQESRFHFVGIQKMHGLDEERPDHGSEIGGGFFNAYDVWKKRKTLIPKKHDIPVVVWETHSNTPIGELMTAKQKRDLPRIL
jgi:hypothetical protein